MAKMFQKFCNKVQGFLYGRVLSKPCRNPMRPTVAFEVDHLQYRGVGYDRLRKIILHFGTSP